MGKRIGIVLAVLGFLCFGGAIIAAVGAIATSQNNAQENLGQEAPQASTSVKSAKAGPVTIEDGVWEVGTDVKAGKYKVSKSVDSDCYWQIARGGSNGDIIDNDIPGGGKPSVTLKAGQEFTSRGCGTWVKQ